MTALTFHDEQASRAERISTWFERASRRPIVLDVTAVSRSRNFSGVQRMVVGFAVAHAQDVLLVRYDRRSSSFRAVRHIAAVKPRRQFGFIGTLRKRLRARYLRLAKEWANRARGTTFEEYLRSLGTLIYHLFLSDDVPDKDDRGLRSWPEWQMRNNQTFVLIDIPTGKDHREALAGLFESQEIPTIVYLHDLFPLSHKTVIAQGARAGIRTNHLRYLDIVNQARLVVCNSKFTQRQYSQFRGLLEEEHIDQKVRVVYPPWPRFHHEVEDFPLSRVSALDELNVLAVGALDRRKNFAVLLRALMILDELNVTVNLVLLAQNSTEMSADFARDYAALPKELRRRVTIIRDKISDAALAAHYFASDVVAVPSLAEGFGLPVTEALACGRPVVAARKTALTELGRFLPVTMVDAHDENEWATALVAAHSTREAVRDLQRPKEIPADWADFRSRLMAKGRYKIS